MIYYDEIVKTVEKLKYFEVQYFRRNAEIGEFSDEAKINGVFVDNYIKCLKKKIDGFEKCVKNIVDGDRVVRLEYMQKIEKLLFDPFEAIKVGQLYSTSKTPEYCPGTDTTIMIDTPAINVKIQNAHKNGYSKIHTRLN